MIENNHGCRNTSWRVRFAIVAISACMLPSMAVSVADEQSETSQSQKQDNAKDAKEQNRPVPTSAYVINVFERSFFPEATTHEAWLRVPVDEADPKAMPVGHYARITLHAVPNETYFGRVIRTNPVVVSVVDPPKLMKAGLTATVLLEAHPKDDLRQVETTGVVAHLHEESLTPGDVIRQGWMRLTGEHPEAPGLQVGDSAIVNIDAMPQQPLRGQVVSVNPLILSFYDPPDRILPGLTAVATLQTREQ